ncbi:MAG TPA: potassium-transporting ATPase subunit KdpC [Candidatus Binataceae bacterium]|nr:potassium-transporting ATPase subunit KdpC [Candidatus Binataceae bacterium]
MRTLITAAVMTLMLTLVTGIIYPIAIYLIAQTVFPWQANGSLVMRDSHVVGSKLIGQNFNQARYFHPRPSAAGDKGYDASNSSGSNLGPTNRKLVDGAKDALHKVLEENPDTTPRQVPSDMITASGSGLDPEISPADAHVQVARVAKARGLSDEAVESLIRENTRGRSAGIFGEPGVNVLELNLALDRLGQETR